MNKNFTPSLYWKVLYLIFVLILNIYSVSYSQKQANIWYFGNGMGLDFNAGATPLKLTRTFSGQHSNDVDEGHATVCDENGNFLFYTNGEQIWDKNADVMQNGTGLLGHWSATQCATIFPLPGNTKTSDLAKYVVLTTPVTSSSTTGIRYNIIDMDPATNGGFATGSVISKNNSMPGAPTSTTEALASCPHWNGADEWVVGHDETNRFFAWKVSADASGTISISAPIISALGNNIAGVAVMKFNNCFNKLAVATHNNSILQVFSFDNKTGIVSAFDANPSGVDGVLLIDVSKTANGSTGAAQGNYGIEFSSSGQYLFISQSGQNFSVARSQRLYRYDLTAGTPPTTASIEASRLTLLDREGTDNAHRLGHLQLAPNGKIYMTHMYTFWAGNGALSVINTPDNASSGFSLESITWAGTRSSMGLPSFHKGFLAGSASLSAADSTGTTSISDLGEICQGIATRFESKYTGSATNYTWDMDAPNGVNPYYGTSADQASAYHRYTAPGDYLVVVTMEDALCGYTVSDTATIKVNPIINTTGNAICGNPISLSVTSLPTAGKNYVWYSDAAMTTPIASGVSPSVPAPLTGTVYVKEVETVTITPTLVTPAIPAKPSVTDSISRIAVINTSGTPHSTTTAPGTSTATSAASPARTTLQVTHPVTLNSFKFAITGGWSSATVQYTVTIKNSGGTIVFGPAVYSGDVRVDGGLNPDGVSTRINFNGNSRRYFLIKPGISLSVDTYSIEIYKSGGTASGTTHNLDLFPTTLANPSIAGSIANQGNGVSRTFIFNINVTTTYIPEVPAVYKDAISSTNKVCSNAGAIPVNCALPVEFIYIRVNSDGEIKWATYNEINNSHFVVERSDDGINFYEIGIVKGSGNTNAISNYGFTDNESAEGYVYYRIKQIDYDGQFSYSDIVSVKTISTNSVIIYPNPNNGEFIVRINKKEDSEIQLEIISILGTIVYTNTIPAAGGVMNLDLSYLARATYFVRISDEFTTSVSKLIIE